MESTMNTEVKPIQQIQPQPKVNLPEPKTTPVEMNTKAVDSSNFTYTPRLVDKSIKLPISKTDPSYSKVKEIINMHIEYSGLEMDFHKLEMAKDHIEAAVYYLRNIE